MELLYRFRNRFLLALALGALVVVGLSLYGDFPKLVGAFGRFDWRLVPFILALTLVNYGMRFIKWNYYLALIGVRDFPKWDSLLIFFAGLAMTMTPGKIGEWLKSYLLKEARGVAYSASAPIVIAERLSDGVAMLLLAMAGLVSYGYGVEVLMVAWLPAIGAIWLSQYRPLALWLLGLGEKVPFVASRMHNIHTFYESAYTLFRFKNLLIAIGLGLTGWFSECVAFYLVLRGLGIEGGVALLLKATFILAASSIAGALSMLPGGLAAAEGSITGLLLVIPDITQEPSVAVAATLIIRFATLWFAVTVGILSLAAYARRLARAAALRDTSPPEAKGLERPIR